MLQKFFAARRYRKAAATARAYSALPFEHWSALHQYHLDSRVRIAAAARHA